MKGKCSNKDMSKHIQYENNGLFKWNPFSRRQHTLKQVHCKRWNAQFQYALSTVCKLIITYVYRNTYVYTFVQYVAHSMRKT